MVLITTNKTVKSSTKITCSNHSIQFYVPTPFPHFQQKNKLFICIVKNYLKAEEPTYYNQKESDMRKRSLGFFFSLLSYG